MFHIITLLLKTKFMKKINAGNVKGFKSVPYCFDLDGFE
jgi:hypothetical protein